MDQSTTVPEKGSMLYVTAICLIAALGGLLFGYDTAVISGAIGFLKIHFLLDSTMEGWTASCALLGCVAGVSFAGVFSDWMGRKKTLVLAGILFLISSIGTALPGALWQFVLFRLLAGVGVGIASMAAPMYIAEVSPARIRGRMVSVNQFAIVTGMLIIYFVNYFIANRQGNSGSIIPSENAFKDLPGLVEKVKTSDDSVSLHIRTQLGYSLPMPNIQPNAALVAEFGRILRTNTFYQADRFSKVALSPATKTLAALNPQGDQLLLLNRMLLEDAYPRQLARIQQDWNVTTGWRWMFASGILPSALFLALLFFAPESPRFLLKQGKGAEALSILGKVDGREFAQREFKIIQEALKIESGSLGQLLQPGLRKMLFIGVALAILQQVTGINVFLYYAPEIFKKLGAGVDIALIQTIVVGVVNLLFTVVAIWTVDRLGRKPLMIIGATGMGICLFAMGYSAQVQSTAIWVLAFVLGYIACFALSVGPVTWVILSEIYPTRIRGRALSIATLCLWTANFIVSQTFPMMDENPTLLGIFHHGFPFYVYGALCVALVILVILWVPETKGKSLEEIEALCIAKAQSAEEKL